MDPYNPFCQTSTESWSFEMQRTLRYRKVSTHVSLRRLRRKNWVDTLRRCIKPTFHGAWFIQISQQSIFSLSFNFFLGHCSTWKSLDNHWFQQSGPPALGLTFQTLSLNSFRLVMFYRTPVYLGMPFLNRKSV